MLGWRTRLVNKMHAGTCGIKLLRGFALARLGEPNTPQRVDRGRWEKAAGHFAIASLWAPNHPRHRQDHALAALAGGDQEEYRRLCLTLLEGRWDRQEQTHPLATLPVAAIGATASAVDPWGQTDARLAVPRVNQPRQPGAQHGVHQRLSKDSGVAAKRLVELGRLLVAWIRRRRLSGDVRRRVLSGRGFRSGRVGATQAVSAPQRRHPRINLFLAKTYRHLGVRDKARKHSEQATERFLADPNWEQLLICEMLGLGRGRDEEIGGARRRRAAGRRSAVQPSALRGRHGACSCSIFTHSFVPCIFDDLSALGEVSRALP